MNEYHKNLEIFKQKYNRLKKKQKKTELQQFFHKSISIKQIHKIDRIEYSRK